MTQEELVGEYRITGRNQDALKSSYEGKLSLSLDETRRVIALWEINGGQVQKGTGFFKDQILVVNFNYIGEQGQVFKGVVVYKCLSKDVLDGFWSEKHADPLFLGAEQAFRIHKNKPLLH